MGGLNWLYGNRFAGGTTGCMRVTGGCMGGAGDVTGGGYSAGGAGNLPSAIFTYNTLCIVNEFFLS